MSEENRMIVFNGKTWYYENVLRGVDKDGNSIVGIKLYGENKGFLREFESADEMTVYLLDEASRGIQDAREEMQKHFMMKMQELQGDRNDAEFAGFLGMKYDTLYQYLTGKRFPSVYALAQIADRCGVTMDSLIGREDDKRKNKLLKG